MIVEHVPSRKDEQMSKNLYKVIKLYERGGFIIRMILTGIDFIRWLKYWETSN